ncbi:MAG: tetratricopeptide repeat protein [Clostridia bacterium]|nr:tetratricopeptide repeat protein [Clostridia bacterium]
MSIGRILLAIALIILVIKRADIVMIFGKKKYSKRDFEGALKVFKTADKIGNLGLGNKLLLGYTCLRCGELENARQHLNLCISLSKPDSANRYRVRNLLALVSWKEGDIDQAIESLQGILEGGYKNSLIYENLGIMYNLKGESQKALEFNLEAFDFNSDDHIILDNLAESYAMTGDYEKAEEIYKDLINRDPEPRFPEAYYNYGKTLMALGKKQEAIEMVEKSLTKTFSYLSIKSKEEIEALLETYKRDA